MSPANVTPLRQPEPCPLCGTAVVVTPIAGRGPILLPVDSELARAGHPPEIAGVIEAARDYYDARAAYVAEKQRRGNLQALLDAYSELRRRERAVVRALHAGEARDEDT